MQDRKKKKGMSEKKIDNDKIKAGIDGTLEKINIRGKQKRKRIL